MGLGHLLGLGGDGERCLCHGCGRMVAVESDDESPTCPECGSTDLEPLVLL